MFGMARMTYMYLAEAKLKNLSSGMLKGYYRTILQNHSQQTTDKVVIKLEAFTEIQPTLLPINYEHNFNTHL